MPNEADILINRAGIAMQHMGCVIDRQYTHPERLTSLSTRQASCILAKGCLSVRETAHALRCAWG